MSFFDVVDEFSCDWAGENNRLVPPLNISGRSWDTLSVLRCVNSGCFFWSCIWPILAFRSKYQAWCKLIIPEGVLLKAETSILYYVFMLCLRLNGRWEANDVLHLHSITAAWLEERCIATSGNIVTLLCCRAYDSDGCHYMRRLIRLCRYAFRAIGVEYGMVYTLCVMYTLYRWAIYASFLYISSRFSSQDGYDKTLTCWQL